MSEKNATLLDVAKETGASGEDMGLIGSILAASANATASAFDRLYEMEKLRRQALEVRIKEFLAAADRAYMGSVREYEAAIDLLRYPKEVWPHEVAPRHEENEEQS